MSAVMPCLHRAQQHRTMVRGMPFFRPHPIPCILCRVTVSCWPTHSVFLVAGQDRSNVYCSRTRCYAPPCVPVDLVSCPLIVGVWGLLCVGLCLHASHRHTICHLLLHRFRCHSSWLSSSSVSQPRHPKCTAPLSRGSGPPTLNFTPVAASCYDG